MRRIFSSDIVESDAFLSMSVNAQLTYFHFCLACDEEGFVGNPKRTIVQILPLNSDSLFGVDSQCEDIINELQSNKFILVFENGVVCIKHFFCQNYLRESRLRPTNYFKEKATLVVEKNNAYCYKGRLKNGKIPIKSKLRCTQNERRLNAECTRNEREMNAVCTLNRIEYKEKNLKNSKEKEEEKESKENFSNFSQNFTEKNEPKNDAEKLVIKPNENSIGDLCEVDELKALMKQASVK